MNLGQASAELQARGFDYLPAGRLTLMLNNGKNAFEDVWRWPWLEATVIGPAPLAIDRLKHVLYVSDDDRKCELMAIDVRDADGGLAQAGAPRYWWPSGPLGMGDTVTLYTWPSNAATVRARVLLESPELVSPDDTPLIPVRYHPLWIDFAVVEAYKDADNYSGAQALHGDIALRLQDVILRYEALNLQHSAPMGARGYSEDE